MPNQQDPGFLWWRAGGYEIHQGVVRPTEPPVPYILRAPSTAWTELKDLERTVRNAAEASLPRQVERDICSWCCRYGLPGYLLQTTQLLCLPPLGGLDGRSQYAVTCYEKGGGWWATHQLKVTDDDSREGEPGPRGPYRGFLERTDLTNAPQPVVWPGEGLLSCVILDRGPASWLASSEPDYGKRTSITRLRQHVRCPPERCPQPGTPAFWNVYQEPVEDFFRAAHLLRWIDTAIEQAGAQSDLAILNQLTSGGWVRGPSSERAWTGASLLTAYAWECLTSRRGVRRCVATDCGAVFLPSRPTQRYHRPRCRTRAGKQRERSKPTPPKEARDSRVSRGHEDAYEGGVLQPPMGDGGCGSQRWGVMRLARGRPVVRPRGAKDDPL